MARMKLRRLEEYLEGVEVFERPKVRLEQYATPPHIAACVLHTIQSSFGDIEGKLVGDLGCGCGTLSVGVALLGGAHCVGFDVDPDALDVLDANLSEFGINNCEALLCDVSAGLGERWAGAFDTVVMNPPFGTRNKGVDMEFLRAGLALSDVVYSLHKTSTRRHVVKKAEDWKVKSRVIAELRFDLPQTYSFHSKNSVDIRVDLIRFHRK